MEADAPRPLPRWYWIVAILALLWMLFGVFAFFMDVMTDEAALQGLSEAERRLYTDRPAWLFVMYAVAIFSGLLGTVGLLLRRTWAVGLLALSLVTAIIQFGYVLFGMRAIEVLGAPATVPFPLLIIAIGAGLLWLGLHARRHGWLT